jgi:hypothetical protein
MGTGVGEKAGEVNPVSCDGNRILQPGGCFGSEELEGRHHDILRALGRSPQQSPRRPRTTVTFAGFPTASCAATSATVKPVNSRAGTRLLSQWRSIGMEGAWYLPPQLGREKILPVSKEPI